MYIYQLSDIQILGFFLVFLRVLSFFIAMPILSLPSVPTPVKILVSFVVSIILYPVVDFSHLTASQIESGLVFVTIHEIVTGLMLGFLCRLLFFAVNIAGQIISLSMGLANAQMFNPAMGSQSSTIEQFQSTLVILFFLAINGHHYFLKGLIDSFSIIPIDANFFASESFIQIIPLSGKVLLIGLQLSMPVMLSIFIMNVAMGIIGRSVPQINVLITSLPANVLLGFLVMLVSLPLFFNELAGALDTLTQGLFAFMKAV